MRYYGSEYLLRGFISFKRCGFFKGYSPAIFSATYNFNYAIMKTKRNISHLILFFLPIFFESCKNQSSKNQIHSFEGEIESPEKSDLIKTY